MIDLSGTDVVLPCCACGRSLRYVAMSDYWTCDWCTFCAQESQRYYVEDLIAAYPLTLHAWYRLRLVRLLWLRVTQQMVTTALARNFLRGFDA